MKRNAFLLCLMLAITSCNKDGVLTEGEKTARKLSDIVSSNNIQIAEVNFGSGFTTGETPFRIDGQFIVLTPVNGNERYFNLAQLNRFELQRRANPERRFIALFF